MNPTKNSNSQRMNIRETSKSTNNHVFKDFKPGTDKYLNQPLSVKNKVH